VKGVKVAVLAAPCGTLAAPRSMLATLHGVSAAPSSVLAALHSVLAAEDTHWNSGGA